MFFSRFIFSFALMLSLVVTPGLVSAQDSAVADVSNEQLFSIIESINTSAGEDSPFMDIKSVSDVETMSDEDRDSLLGMISQPGFNLGESAASFEPPANCFDYYTFGSVDAQLFSSSDRLVSGSNAVFTANLTNNNPYPVVDAGIYIKIFKQQPEGKSSIQMNPLVDQFQAVSGISMRVSETVTRDFSRMLPAGLPSGDYQAVAYVAVSDRYNLLGLPFTDDIIGGTFNFTVLGESDEMVAWNREQVFVNNEQYYFAAYTPKVSPTDPINISSPLHNPTESPVDAEVTWSVYRWDQQRVEQLLSTETKIVSIAAGDTVYVPYTISDTDYAVYVLVGEAVVNGVKSIIDVRVTREGIPTTRINYPGVTNFPLVAGEENTIFSCMHIAGTPDIVDGGSLVLTLADTNGKEIFQHTYTGPITGAMMATAETFVPNATYQDFSLTASLYQDDVLVDEAYLIYDCKTLTGGECSILAADKPSLLTPENVKSALTIALAALVIILFIIHYMRRRPEHIVAGSIMLLAFFGGLGGVEKVEAKTIQSNDSYNGLLLYGGTAKNWLTLTLAALESPAAQVTYEALVRDLATGKLVHDNSTVSVGDRIEFLPSRKGISWTGTGYTSDTPQGVWRTSASFPDGPITSIGGGWGGFHGSKCSPQFYVGNIANPWVPGQKYAVYIPLSVHTAPIVVDVSGSTAVLKSLGGNKYRVDSAGMVIGVFNYAATYGKYYYQYINHYMKVCTPTYGGAAIQQVIISGGKLTKPEYKATFPAKSITYNLTAVGTPPPSNNPPSDPVISPPDNALEGDLNTFAITSTDLDNDALYYEIDWDMDGLMDQRTPNSGTVASGVSENVSRTWNTYGSYDFQVRAVDINNAPSGWTLKTISITAPSSATALLELSVNGGMWSASDQTVSVGDSVDLRWTSTNATACSGTAFNTSGNIAGNVALVTPIGGSSQTYQINCTGAGASGGDSITLNVLAVPLPTITLASNVDGGGFTATDKTINSSQQVQYRWSTVGATSCTGIGIPSLAGVSGTVDIGEPSPGFSTTYGVRCFNSVGDFSDQVLQISTRQPITMTLSAEVDGLLVPVVPEVVVTSAENVTLSWTSTNATTCTGTNFSTGSAVSAVGVNINEPLAGSQQTYSITCTDSYGQSASESVLVRTIGPPNLLPLVGNIVPSTGFDSVTGNYNSVTIAYSTRNNGDSEAYAFTNQITMDVGNNGSVDNTVNQPLVGLVAGVDTSTQSVVLATNVPFGNHKAVIKVDNNNAVPEANELDNQVVRIVSLPVPDPGLVITVDEVVGNRKIANVEWNTGSTFPMNCSVFGAGVVTVNFDPSVAGATGSVNTGEISSKSEVTIRCSEPITGTIFTASDVVETVGKVEEI
ncbi:MAG: hypothetical protein LR008_01350 [Candidatus Pacebacteria bacterium]|nr:hypothetical protein [Candidatus Paceibacterota bacterium]